MPYEELQGQRLLVSVKLSALLDKYDVVQLSLEKGLGCLPQLAEATSYCSHQLCLGLMFIVSALGLKEKHVGRSSGHKKVYPTGLREGHLTSTQQKKVKSHNKPPQPLVIDLIIQ